MNKGKKIFSILITIISILLILLNIYIIYEKVTLKSDTVNIFGYSFFVVVSGSMEPNISVDDLIIIKKQDYYTIDDVVTYKSTKTLVTHRIIRIDEEDIYTKGDNNNTEDEPIKREQIKGKVKHIIKGVGKLINILSAPVTIAILIGIVFFVFANTGIKKSKH